ncbi:glycosyltransferase [Spirulina sp. 06S082]|uniref:glycosyltransferase n=1 Tax=Spirulina sp. 06S082 TaxID=3110248 RepID=UPI002B1FA593|nr:glycosyltransferase [Spirulina sp. 06S082]MEA5470689.1 glycosyltransferase [Spirulina sp. 06S082]
MKKLAFLIRSLDIGGAERQLVTLVKGMDKARFEIAVFYFYGGGALEQELQDSQVQTICLQKRDRWDIFGFFSRLLHHLQQFQPDILHGYLSTSNLIALFLKPFLPKTRIFWGVRASNLDLSQYDWFTRLNFQLECLLSQFADRIIINSQTGKEYHLQHGFPSQKITVIPNGIDTNSFYPDPDARARIRLEWGIEYQIILVGLVGRLDPIKDHFTFLHAAKLLSDRKNNVCFVCVGSGEESYQHKLQEFAKELGIIKKIIWTGMRNDMPAVYNALDVVTSCSLSEGFSNAIAEAMSCGVSCVVTDVGDSAWIVDNTGVVVPIEQPEKLCQGWLSCWDKISTKERFGEENAARKRILDNFSVEKLVAQTEKILL